MQTRSFETGLEQNIEPLMRYARRLTRNQDTAQDLVQDTMIQALRHKDRITACAYPDRYLAIMLRNLNTSQYRKRLREPDCLDCEDANLCSADAPAPALQTCREVMEAILELPSDYAVILLLSARDGLSYKEISRHLNIPIGTVMSRLHRARTNLRQVINLDEHEKICEIFSERI